MLIPIGIDLGTTCSVVATVDENGRPRVLRNRLGEEITPSVVCFESPTSVLVGTAARNAAAVVPDLTVTLVKRQMGTDRRFAYHGHEYSPEAISALILRGLLAGVLPEDRPGWTAAVITVPAYFGIREREATQQAGLLADIEVLELVSEPVAAALHYGLSAASTHGTVLVYDLGGGTFDVTALTFDGGVRVVATDGDAELGGADWDSRLAAHLLDRFVQTVDPCEDPADDATFMAELRGAAERAKHALSTKMSHTVRLGHAGRSAALVVERGEFESITRDLVDSTLHCLRRLMATAALTPERVSGCVLVGGSSRMPMISAALAGEFGWTPRLHDPDLAVAKGAALRARQLVDARQTWTTPSWGTEAVGEPSRQSAPVPQQREGVPFAATSVVPRSFGLLIHDSDDPAGQRRFVDHVIHQNDPLPVIDRETVVATILKGQTTVRIEVYEQAGAVPSVEVHDNRRALDGELSGLPEHLPAGAPIRVRLSLDLAGRLSVTAIEPSSGVRMELAAYIDGVLDTAEREHMARTLSALAIRH
ncbi:Hsp70 family protein [Micromonospora sp. DT229]|uniref:Hsp70 family protein n=1 Tax=Micromonospora sp. DT229 TaxID=3393430 RepID=UPI003CFB2ED2